MGAPERSFFYSAQPAHSVTLTHPFELQTTEVTQAQWEAVMGDNPSKIKGIDLPVDNVSWDQCQEFISFLNDAAPDRNYRLPTEAEWEYACRAGTEFGLYGERDEISWYNENSKNTSHAVGQKKPNAWGLHDMLGNVSEWCADWYADYTPEPLSDPKGPSTGFIRIVRGGDWTTQPWNLFSFTRFSSYPDMSANGLGFRLARSVH